MKNLLFIFIIITASCSPQKRLSRIYDRHPELLDSVIIEETQISYTYDTIYKDTTITVSLPKDTVMNQVIIYKTDTTVFSDTVIASNTYTEAEAYINSDSLYIRLTNKDSARFNILLQQIKEYKEILEKSTSPVLVTATPQWMKIIIWIFIGSTIILGGLIILIAKGGFK
jgi:hypothetical protein